MSDPGAGAVVGFVGVDTGGSSIHRVFPEWARVLGVPAEVRGHDLPVGAGAEQTREVVARIADDPQHAGALITTHKMAVHDAAGDLFDELDDLAERFGEISSVSKKDGRLVGHAKDPVSAGLALQDFLATDHFARTGGHALVLGCGGAGAAITWCLSRRQDPPRRIVCADHSSLRLDRLVATQAGGEVPLRTVLARGVADGLVAELPPGSLVVNATGRGKDVPGSPLSGQVEFPEGGIAWELNYRGSLDFLHQAEQQVPVVDGWRYFVHGWSQVLAEVFGVELTGELLEQLARAAERVR